MFDQENFCEIFETRVLDEEKFEKQVSTLQKQPWVLGSGIRLLIVKNAENVFFVFYGYIEFLETDPDFKLRLFGAVPSFGESCTALTEFREPKPKTRRLRSLRGGLKSILQSLNSLNRVIYHFSNEDFNTETDFRFSYALVKSSLPKKRILEEVERFKKAQVSVNPQKESPSINKKESKVIKTSPEGLMVITPSKMESDSQNKLIFEEDVKVYLANGKFRHTEKEFFEEFLIGSSSIAKPTRAFQGKLETWRKSFPN